MKIEIYSIEGGPRREKYDSLLLKERFALRDSLFKILYPVDENVNSESEGTKDEKTAFLATRDFPLLNEKIRARASCA